MPAGRRGMHRGSDDWWRGHAARLRTWGCGGPAEYCRRRRWRVSRERIADRGCPSASPTPSSASETALAPAPSLPSHPTDEALLLSSLIDWSVDQFVKFLFSVPYLTVGRTSEKGGFPVVSRGSEWGDLIAGSSPPSARYIHFFLLNFLNCPRFFHRLFPFYIRRFGYETVTDLEPLDQGAGALGRVVRCLPIVKSPTVDQDQRHRQGVLILGELSTRSREECGLSPDCCIADGR